MLPILLYHRIADVSPHQDRRRLAVSPEEFAWQMKYLHRAGYSCLSLPEVMRGSYPKLQQSRKCFALTFDDGYADFYAHAFPILRQYGFTATVFLVAERVGRRSLWEGQDGDAAADLLSWDVIRELARQGIDFGSHTLTHPRLTRFSREAAAYEIAQSKAVIEDRLGRRIDLFSYPYGASNPRVQEIVRESGYTAAFGVDRGSYGRFHQWRVQCLGQEGLWSFYRKTHGWSQRVIWLREQSPIGQPLRRALHTVRHGAASRPPGIRGVGDD